MHRADLPIESRSLTPRRLLVRGVNWLGDAVMTTPALQRLREAHPQARITLLTPVKLSELWQAHPSIDAVVSFAEFEGPQSVAHRLRAESFDTAVVFPNSPRSALDVWLAGIPNRIGYARPWRNWFLTQRVPNRADSVRMPKRSTGEIRRLINSASPSAPMPSSSKSSAHQIHDYLHLASALGASPEPVSPILVVTNQEIESVVAKFKLPCATTGNRPFFGLNPGAEYGPAKRWPIDRFAAAAREIQQRTNCIWLLLGARPDLPASVQLQSALATSGSAFNLAGQTTLRDLCALLKLCRILLTNDTGPMHVAAALGVPVVVPFGSTSPELTGPGMPGDSRHRLLKSEVPCSPCFRRVCPIDFRCMRGITADQVIAAVLQIAQ